jgi:CheY-like chemotaxis protein
MARILVIDDDSEDLEAIESVLTTQKYSVVTCNNGAKAFDILKKDGFDLIMIDIKMPTLSGYDLLRLLREKLNHKVKMIYVTIVPKKEVDLDDIDGFVQKPFSPGVLIKEVKKVLKD